MRFSIRTVVPVIVGLLMLGAVPSASADPTYPSQTQVDAAKAAANAKAVLIGQLESQLVTARAQLDALQVSAEQAIEAYNGAEYALSQAQDAANAATMKATQAGQNLDQQRATLGQFAAQSYRSGGNLSTVTMVLDASGPAGIIDRLNLIGALSNNLGTVYQQYDGAKIAAGVFQDQAATALTTSKRLAGQAETARKAAEAAVASQAADTAALTARENDVVVELAAARGVAVQLEQQRQAGIKAEQEAAAAAAAAEAAKPPPPPVKPPTQQPTKPPTQQPTQPPTHPPTQPPTQPPTEPPPTEPPPTEPPPTDPPPAHGVADVIAFAHAQLGKWYEWGADGPDTYDCSGLTMRAWQQAGVYLPHWSVGQYAATTPISTSDMEPGDLLFWASGSSYTSIYHVALYIGNGYMIEAPHTGAQVRIATIPWSNFFGATRVN